MRLESIIVSGLDGLKGWTGSEACGAVDVFAGPNGAGKSTRLLAVLAGLRGLAETPSDNVREYLGPALPSAVVELEFDTARLSRCLADGARTAAAKKADALSEAVVGGHIVRWDLSDFATATPSVRQALLDRVCDLAAGGWTPELLIERLQKQLGNDDPVLGELAANQREDRADAWLNRATEWARRAYTDANAARRQRAAEAEALLSETTDEYLEAPAELNERLEQLQARAEGLASTIREGRALQRRAGSAEEDRQQLIRLEAWLHANPPIEDEHGDLEARLGEAARVRVEADQVRKAQQLELNAARVALGRAEATVAAREEHLSGPCRHCGHADPLGAAAALEEARTELERARETVDDIELEVVAAEGEARLALEAYREARAAVDLQRKRDEAERRVDELRQRLEDTPAFDAEQQHALEVEREELREQIRELTARRDRAVRASERERLVQLAIAARDEAIERFERVVALGKALKALKERLVTEAFRPLETEASAIVGPVLGGRVVFRSGADFGLEREGSYVPWWSLSDGERAVVGAGLSYAFARLGGAKWRAVILDGAEAIDGDRLQSLLHQLVTRVRVGDLDNALVALRADEAPELPSGVTVHWLGAEEAPLEVTCA